MTVLIIDYGMGNLASARRSFEECDATVVVSDHPSAARSASRIVIPGVGAFGEAMQRLRSAGWVDAIREAADEGVPVLGICLGMQLLAEEGDEGSLVQGFGLVRARIERMTPKAPGERIPHVGWNEVYPRPDAKLFRGIAPGSDFFFVHSYHLVPRDQDAILATTPYCGGIVSAVQQNQVMGVQFHPEKSSQAGFQLIRNFLAN
jgi:imidazole glycerol-phosphate synthase subunit HisH